MNRCFLKNVICIIFVEKLAELKYILMVIIESLASLIHSLTHLKLLKYFQRLETLYSQVWEGYEQNNSKTQNLTFKYRKK